MTKLPMQNRGVIGIDGPEYELNQRCPVIGCTERGHERHHLWRRSFLGGDYWWVQIPDGRQIANCIGLCNNHHRKVTENEVGIVFMDDCYWWVPSKGDISMLAWQPPQLVAEVIPEGNVTIASIPADDPLHDHDHTPECPTCHQRIKPPKSQTAPEVKKNRRTWSIAVPKERQEDGADVLDTLIDEARKELDSVGISYGDEHKYKYHVLATAMAMFVAHGRQIMANG